LASSSSSASADVKSPSLIEIEPSLTTGSGPDLCCGFSVEIGPLMLKINYTLSNI
jgi:hypothetical protein